ncbi:ISAs1 family transposase [Mesorhizobium sp.]|uniref:ISAs1 family transposase n=1 Tax=Mesorhizobium sp. TaxID=1871066 RepID=UPI00338E691F
MMNRIDPGLFSAAYTAWVRQTWPDKPDFIAIDGKTSRRSHDGSEGRAPLHLVSAFATTSRLVLGQEAVSDKSSETTAIPVLLERLAANDGPQGHARLDRRHRQLPSRNQCRACTPCGDPRSASAVYINGGRWGIGVGLASAKRSGLGARDGPQYINADAIAET